MRAERAAVAVGQARVAHQFPGQRGRDVALAVPGGGQDQRHRDDRPRAAVPGRHQSRNRVRHGRAGQLDEPAVDRRDPAPGAGAHLPDEPGEPGHARVAAGAMADDEQGRANTH